MIILIFLFTLSAAAKALQDEINFNPSGFLFQNDWWLGKGIYSWDKRSWLQKYILSFTFNGWHFLDALRLFSLLLIIGILLGTWWYSIIGYILYGLIFEFFYAEASK